MTDADIRLYRLINQQIAGTQFTKPEEIVTWMGAMQAQEYAMTKWAIGLRLPFIHDDDVENAFNRGEILRTHLLRPTWHFVSPADIRWMLKLTAPRVNAANAFMYRKMELDDAIFNKCNNILVNELQGGKQLTRAVLNVALQKENIHGDGVRLSCLMMRAELDGIICSGAREGNQFTYALLDERVPSTKSWNKEEALTELSRRYFTSRGPATIRDFAYWSGFTIKDAAKGLSAIRSQLIHEIIDGKDYFFPPPVINQSKKIQDTFLMPDYDEYGMSYKDRSATAFQGDRVYTRNPVFDRMLIIDGKIEGTWKRNIKGKTVVIEMVPFKALKSRQKVLNAAKRFSDFIRKDLIPNISE